MWTTAFTASVTGRTGAFEEATGEIHGVNYAENVHSDGEAKELVDAPATMMFEGLIEY